MKTLSAYYIINLVFFLLLTVILIFAFTIPLHKITLPCLVKNISGATCGSCGFTSSFVEWISGSRTFRSLQPGLVTALLFFIIQWIIRLLLLLSQSKIFRLYFTGKLDIAVSLSLFLLAFLPVIIL